MLFRSRSEVMVEYFGLHPEKVFPGMRVWQIFTYAFLHDSSGGFPTHIIFNLLVFYFFAPAVENLWGPRRFVRFLIIAILVPGIVSMFFYYQQHTAVIGASGVVFAVLTANAFIWPRKTILLFFIIPMPAFAFILMILAIEVYYTLSGIALGSTGIANIAHLAGAGVGWYAVRRQVSFSWLKNPFAGWFKERQQKRDISDEERADTIFRKIAHQGIGSLTSEEKRFLDDYSRRKRGY